MDNTQIATGYIVRDEDIGNGVKMPVTKIYLGAHGVDGGPVTPTNPLPVTSSGISSGITTASVPAQTTIGTSAALAVAANSARKKLIIINTGTTVLYLTYGSTNPTASVYHFPLQACTLANDGTGGSLIDDWPGAVQIISSAPGGTYVLTELS